jgi:HAD superfamily hydrolase (TIGR01549 family)
MKPRYTVAQVLAETGPILLDFDGPVCRVFATLAASTVAAELRRLLAEHRAVMPQWVETTDNPLEVLRFTGSLRDRSLIARIEDQLRRAEVAAVTGAEPTPYAREVIVSAHEAGRPIAIVSNNSAPAIHHYLGKHRLAGYIDVVVGRAYADPSLMKPNPTPILRAVAEFDTKPASCVLIGDSTSDMDGGRAAGVRTIAFANRPRKRQHLIRAGADAATEGTDGMAELAAVLLNEAAAS